MRYWWLTGPLAAVLIMLWVALVAEPRVQLKSFLIVSSTAKA